MLSYLHHTKEKKIINGRLECQNLNELLGEGRIILTAGIVFLVNMISYSDQIPPATPELVLSG
jgi:hypothetical protein